MNDCIGFHDEAPVITQAPIYHSLIRVILLDRERVMLTLMQQTAQCAFGNAEPVFNMARRNSFSVKPTETNLPHHKFN
jgi:hypothetical protein